MALLIGFVVVPAVDLIRMSFTDWDGLASSSKFIGLENYVRMFQNPDLWLSLKNNAVYFFVHLLDDIRASIDGGYFDEFRDATLARFYANGSRG